MNPIQLRQKAGMEQKIMNIQEAMNPSIDDAIKYYRSMIFPQDMSAHTLRAIAINELTIKALLEKAARAEPENKALTLEQLKQMNGMPVWVVCRNINAPPCLMRVQRFRSLCGTDDKEYYELFADYGKTWLAYVRKPEGSKSNA